MSKIMAATDTRSLLWEIIWGFPQGTAGLAPAVGALGRLHRPHNLAQQDAVQLVERQHRPAWIAKNRASICLRPILD